MRGVVAMNLEAMNILEPDADKNNLLNMTNNIVDLNHFNENKMSFTNPITSLNTQNDNVQVINNSLNTIPNQNLNTKNYSEKQEFNFINNEISDINSNSNQNIQPEFLEKKVNY